MDQQNQLVILFFWNMVADQTTKDKLMTIFHQIMLEPATKKMLLCSKTHLQIIEKYTRKWNTLKLNDSRPFTLSLNRSGGLGGKSYSMDWWLDNDTASINVIATSKYKHSSSIRTRHMRAWSQRATEQFHLTVAALYRMLFILCLREKPN